MATTTPKHKATPSTKTTREQRLKSVKESKIPF
ncbi:flagellar biosynthesis protein FlgG [Helicobacter pylori]|nr:flagellar biosynthesis protein FlgG [Helicobacter pylori]NHA90509.1 flagellar biosynthesis protein FlgG [Helicobacter pylori]QEF23663.1 flagellar biosynthesis protein FlgG [Helicobacter pylori]